MRIENIPLKKIKDSPFQHRGDYPTSTLKELAASIAAKGVLQPVTVREVNAHFELVFGHRRVRAARLAELDEIPAVVRKMSDEEVVEVQIVENAQREDVDPLDEAEAYEQLHKKFGHTAEQIAAKVGKSKSHVYGRMKLTELCPAGRKAYREGKFGGAEVALLVARIPDRKVQEQAVAAIVEKAREEWSEDRSVSVVPLSLRGAQALVRSKFMLKLAEAPFDITDATLDAKAGACGGCPKRTGNAMPLFPELAKADKDLCTDPACWGRKSAAAWKVKAEEAEKKGLRVLTDAEAAKVFDPYSPEHLRYNAGYVLPGNRAPDKAMRTYAQIEKALGDKAPARVLVRAPDGRAVELLPASIENAAETPAQKKRAAEERERQAKEKAKGEHEREIDRRVDALAMAEIIKDGPEVAILRYAVLAGLNSGTLCRNSAARWPDLVDKETGELDPEKVAKAGPLTAESWRGLLAEVLVDPFDAGAEEAFALDFKALRKQAAEEMKAEAKATEPPAPTAKE